MTTVPHVDDWSVPEGYGEPPGKTLYADEKPKYWMAKPEGTPDNGQFTGYARFVVKQWTPNGAADIIATRVFRWNAKKIVDGLRLLAEQEC